MSMAARGEVSKKVARAARAAVDRHGLGVRTSVTYYPKSKVRVVEGGNRDAARSQNTVTLAKECARRMR